MARINVSHFWDYWFTKRGKRYEKLNLIKIRTSYILRYIPANAKILDIGYGTGFLLRECAKRQSGELYGFDLPRKDDVTLKNKFKKLGIRIFHGKLSPLPFPNVFLM